MHTLGKAVLLRFLRSMRKQAHHRESMLRQRTLHELMQMGSNLDAIGLGCIQRPGNAGCDAVPDLLWIMLCPSAPSAQSLR